VGPGRTLTVVIGIGVNCAHHPPMAAERPTDDLKPAGGHAAPFGEAAVLFPATDLRAHGADVTAQQLFMRLSATMSARLAQWGRGEGFTAILGDWLTSAVGLGDPIRIRQDGNDKTGRFVGLDQAGRLVLEHSGGRLEKISAGDVFPFARPGGPEIPSQRAK
jgi:BirA family biotin operon repressor/biotin-[acetyl-CoA-carboxylase] ligase